MAIISKNYLLLYFVLLLDSKKESKEVLEKISIFLEHKLDFFKAAQSLKSWQGHASRCTSLKIINTVQNKCEWIYR